MYQFADAKSPLRIGSATAAFGMGVDASSYSPWYQRILKQISKALEELVIVENWL